MEGFIFFSLFTFDGFHIIDFFIQQKPRRISKVLMAKGGREEFVQGKDENIQGKFSLRGFFWQDQLLTSNYLRFPIIEVRIREV